MSKISVVSRRQIGRILKPACLALLALGAQTAAGQLFSDNFTRTNDPGALAPWVAQSGNWTVTGGVLQGGADPAFSYGRVYLTNIWTEYSVQGRIQFPATAYGGGIGGYLDPVTGAHYAAWLYPSNSVGASNVVRLVKFQSWNLFGYTNTSYIPMQEAKVGIVGTNWHTLKLMFRTNQVTVTYDGTQLMTVTDAEAQPYASGGVTIERWTDAAGYVMQADDVVVTANPNRPVANPDSYTAIRGRTLTVPAPGVLANDAGGSAPLRAILVSGVSHGTLNLSTNGGFAYTPSSSYTGPDSFTYRATDGVTNSSSTTVSLTVVANHTPVANNDSYTLLENTTLSVPAPGILANDTDADGDALTPLLSANVSHGSLTLNADGSFAYTPEPDYIGADSFTYRVKDVQSTSSVATVSLSIASDAALFFDNFLRATDPGALSPWTAQIGAWTPTGGTLQCGPNPVQSYGYAYTPGAWSNYAVEADIRFASSNVWGGGLGGRLDPVTGAHYGAWIYPEGSPGGSNVLKLIKFQSWTTFGYNGISALPMQEAALPAVGTNWHSLKLGFFGNRIAVYFDGAMVMSVADLEAQPWSSGGLTLESYTGSAPYLMLADDVIVRPLAADDSYTLEQDSALTVAAPGVLANDTRVFGTSLTANVVVNPTNGVVNLNTNGGFTYTPNSGYVGPDAFLYSALDGQTNLGTAAVSLNVRKLNHPPTLPVLAPVAIDELTPLTVTNTAADIDLPPQNLTYQLIAPTPGGAAISADGVITWTPTDAQGPSTNTIRTVVTDDGIPRRSATNDLTVIVNEVNTAPTLPAQADRTINELTTVTLNNAATDTDLPVNPLTYSLTGPSNATISASGVITWTPTEAQGPSTNTFITVVTDSNPWDPLTPSLSATNSFTVVVNEINSAPVLPAQADRTIAPLTTLIVANTASDSDIPTNSLTYTLLVGPANATLSPDGILTWTPTEQQNDTTNLFRAVVTDDNPWALTSQQLSATNSFTVFVNTRPVLSVDSATLAGEGCPPTNGVIDPGETVTMLFAITNSGTGNTTNLVVTLLEANGVTSPSAQQTYGVVPAGGAPVTQPFTFTAAGSCGGSISAILQLQDGPTSLGTLTNTFSLGPNNTALSQSFDAVATPALPPDWTTAASGAQLPWITVASNSASAPNTLFAREAAGIGVSEVVSPTLVPGTQGQLAFQNNYNLEASTTTPTNAYDGGVLEIQIGTNAFVDILAAGGSFVTNGYNAVIDTRYQNPLAGRAAWSGNSGGYVQTVVNLPAAAAGQAVRLKWRCGTDTSNTRTGWWIDNISVTGWDCCVNAAPVLAAQTNRTVSELATLTVTNTVASAGAPAGPILYSLQSPPAGAQIDSDGVITWTPNEAQGPGVYTLTTVAANSTYTSLAATNSFTVTVLEVNAAPVLLSQPDLTVAELSRLVVTNSATDPDLPVNQLSYALENPPPGAAIDNHGVITWTPTEAQGPGTYQLTTIATDDGSPPLSATNSFTVLVVEVNTAPVLPAQPDRTIAEGSQLVVTNTATDADLPANTLTYTLLTAPTNATIDPQGIITWTPVAGQDGSTNRFQTKVTDDNPWALVDQHLSTTNSFLVVVPLAALLPRPVFQSIQVSNGVAYLSWSAAANRTYRLQYVSSIADTNWQDLVPDIVATTTNAVTTNAVENSLERYYRVYLLP